VTQEPRVLPGEGVDKDKVKPIPSGAIPFIKPIMRVMSAANVWIYRTSGGKVWGKFNGSEVCLVTMTGRKSGRRITIPLIYIPDGDDVLIVASQGGMDRHPIWYGNLVANPEIEIQAGAEVRKMVARQASASEKVDLWPKLLAVYPDFDEYQARTERDIPVMICSPR
jgi:deazaflavin-dependent oxidoreductase (nitroreductase family)